MSEKPQDWDRSRDEIISGEYVLGVLSEEERRRVEARIATDPKFARQVRRWQTNLAAFNPQDDTDLQPPAQNFDRLEARFFTNDLEDEGEVILPRRRGGSLWDSVSFWRGLAGAAAVIAAGIFIGDRVDISAGASKPLVAELTGMDSPISLLAHYDFDTGRLSVTPAALKEDGPKALEIWLIEDENAPTSLGLLPENGDIAIPEAMRKSFAEGRTIAITIEPSGGAPEGKPTGPVIALGKTRLL